MQHSLKDDYANCVKNYTNQFKENSFRKLACNDFKVGLVHVRKHGD